MQNGLLYGGSCIQIRIRMFVVIDDARMPAMDRVTRRHICHVASLADAQDFVLKMHCVDWTASLALQMVGSVHMHASVQMRAQSALRCVWLTVVRVSAARSCC